MGYLRHVKSEAVILGGGAEGIMESLRIGRGERQRPGRDKALQEAQELQTAHSDIKWDSVNGYRA